MANPIGLMLIVLRYKHLAQQRENEATSDFLVLVSVEYTKESDSISDRVSKRLRRKQAMSCAYVFDVGPIAITWPKYRETRPQASLPPTGQI